MNAAPNIGNRALEQDFRLIRSLIECVPVAWLAVVTRSRFEERVAAGIRSAGLVAYLPMIPDVRKSGRSGKQRDASRPMFSSYVFAGVDPHALSTGLIRDVDGVESILSFRDDMAPHVIPARQMLPIVAASQQAQLGQKSVIGHGFAIGDGVVITAGAAKFYRGTIRDLDERKGTARVDLKVMGAERAVTVPVDKLDRS